MCIRDRERVEDSIQEQSASDDFELDKLWETVSTRGISRTDFISFIIGALIQGGGNIFSRDTVEKAAKDQAIEIADKLPDDGQGGTPEQKIERATPEAVEGAVQEFQEETSQVGEFVRDRAKMERLVGVAEEAIENGVSKNEIALALSSHINPSQAQEIVLALPEPKVKEPAPVTDDDLAITPASIQQSVTENAAAFNNDINALTKEVESLKEAVKDAPNTPNTCLLYTSPSPRDRTRSRMPSSA